MYMRGVAEIPAIQEVAVEQLLGRPLNPYEKRYAPQRLFICGLIAVPFQFSRVAVIGTRQPSPEGLAFVKKLVKKLSDNRVIIVSGLARGIDTAAHREAIRCGGQTVAVLGTPLTRFYPPENKELQLQIMSQHLAISQFPENHITRRRDFILRNRTMALISDATVIVEAGETSGSLSQGWETLRLGRPLFISPIILDRRLKWPQSMMNYGARVLSDVEELLDELPAYDFRLEKIIKT